MNSEETVILTSDGEHSDNDKHHDLQPHQWLWREFVSSVFVGFLCGDCFVCFNCGSCFLQDVCSCTTPLVISRDLVPNVFVGVELFVVATYLLHLSFYADSFIFF